MTAVRQILAICGTSIFKEWSSYRNWIVLFIAGIFSFSTTSEYVRLARQIARPIGIFEPFVGQFSSMHMIILVMAGFILMISSAPFFDETTALSLVRVGRNRWLCGQVLYILFLTIFYLFFIWMTSVLASVTYAFIGNEWSDVAFLVARTNAANNVAITFSTVMIRNSSPYNAFTQSFSLLTLHCFLTGIVCLIINTIQKGMLGVVTAFLVQVFGWILRVAMLNRLYFLSPLNNAILSCHSYGYGLDPSIAYSFIYFSLLIILSLTGLLLFSGKLSFHERKRNL